MFQNISTLVADLLIFGAIGFEIGRRLLRSIKSQSFGVWTVPFTFEAMVGSAIILIGLGLAIMSFSAAWATLLVGELMGDDLFNVSFVGLGILGNLAGYAFGIGLFAAKNH